MPETARREFSIEIPWRTIGRILLATFLVWCALRLAHVFLALIVAVLLAVLLDPIARWLERRGLARWAAATAVTVAILITVGAFLWLTWATLDKQWEYVIGHLEQWRVQIANYIPRWLEPGSGGLESGTSLTSMAIGVGRSAVTAMALLVFGFVVAIYLLVDGRRTYHWLMAFVPLQQRPRLEETFEESRGIVFDYMAGNAITSLIAAVATWVALWLLGVPAALLLALLAGVSDFVPVIGFVLSAIPAVLLALTVSTTTGLIVIAFYIAYNAVETYLIAPRVYGERMRLSDLAVLVAFAVGAELAGVIGALIALPLAATYPTIERLWLRQTLPDETVHEHEALGAARD